MENVRSPDMAAAPALLATSAIDFDTLLTHCGVCLLITRTQTARLAPLGRVDENTWVLVVGAKHRAMTDHS